MIHAIQHKMLGLLKGSKSFLIDEDDLVLIDAGHSWGGPLEMFLGQLRVWTWTRAR